MLRKLLTTLLALLICFSFASCKKNKGNHEYMTFLEKDGGRIGLLDEQVLFEKGKASSKLDLFILEKKEDGFHYDSPDVKLIFQEEELRLLERSLQSFLGQV